eukprot:g59644.t1
MSQHGAHLASFYHAIEKYTPVFLLIRNSNGSIFGSFTNKPWIPSQFHFGTGESFVFSMAAAPEPKTPPRTQRMSTEVALSTRSPGALQRSQSNPICFPTEKPKQLKQQARLGRRANKLQLRIFHWAYSNELFQFANDDHISVGGGDTGPVFHLDSKLHTGMSGSLCETFNAPLLAGSREWKCYAFEAWAAQEGDDSGRSSPMKFELGPTRRSTSSAASS